MELNKRTKIILICAAAAMIIGAAALNISLEARHPFEPLAAELRERGWEVQADEFYNMGSFRDSSVEDVLEGQDLSEAAEASRAGGFPGDIKAVGDITMLLHTGPSGDVLTLFLRDGRIELCFIQQIGGGVRPIS